MSRYLVRNHLHPIKDQKLVSESHCDDFSLEIERCCEKSHSKYPLTWPSHMLVFGSTMSGKTTLIANILDNIDLVYSFEKPYNAGKIIVVSPIDTLEIANHMSSIHSWDIELYNNIEMNEEFEEHLIKRFRLLPENTLKISDLKKTLHKRRTKIYII